MHFEISKQKEKLVREVGCAGVGTRGAGDAVRPCQPHNIPHAPTFPSTWRRPPPSRITTPVSTRRVTQAKGSVERHGKNEEKKEERREKEAKGRMFGSTTTWRKKKRGRKRWSRTKEKERERDPTG